MIPLICGIADLEDEFMVTGRKSGQGTDRLGGWEAGTTHTAAYKIENQQGPTVGRREPCSALCDNLNRKRI